MISANEARKKYSENYIEIHDMKSLVARINHIVVQDQPKNPKQSMVRKKILEWLGESYKYLNSQERDQIIDPAWELANTILAICDDIALKVSEPNGTNDSRQ